MTSLACSVRLQVPMFSGVESSKSSSRDRSELSSKLKHNSAFDQPCASSRRKTLNPARNQRLNGVVARGAGYGDNWQSTVVQPMGSQAQQMPKSAEADVMGLLLRQRIVFLGHELNDYVADATVSQLLLLDAQDPNKVIRLFINCPGGSMSAAMAIFDAIQLCRAPVSTIAFGIAASTATLLLAVGSPGRRFAMPNARIMMHQPLGGASGQAIDVEIQAKEIMHHKTNITRLIAQITNKSYEQVEKDIDRDRYMSPVEAMEYGIIDGVIDEASIMPLLPMPERVKPRAQNFQAEQDPRKFLIPTIPDDEIY